MCSIIALTIEDICAATFVYENENLTLGTLDACDGRNACAKFNIRTIFNLKVVSLVLYHSQK